MEPETSNITQEFLTPEQLAGVRTAEGQVNQFNRQPIAPIAEPAPITADALATATPLNIPTTTPPVTPPVGEVTSPVQGLLDQAVTEEEQTLEQQQGEDLTQNIISGLDATLGESAERTRQLQAAGVSDLRKGLQAINTKILGLNAEIQQSDTQLIANQRAEEVRDTLLPFARSSQAKLAGDAAILRALKTSEVGVLTAQALAKQGDIGLAIDEANSAVDAKYAPYKEAISVWEAQLKALEPTLTAQEKKQSAALKRKNTLADREVDRQIANEKEVRTLSLEAAGLGAPDSVLSNLSDDPAEAIAALAPFFAQKNNEITKLDNGDTVVIDKLTGRVIRNIGGAETPAGSQGFALTKETIDSIHGGDLVSALSDIVSNSGFKNSQSLNDVIGVVASAQQLANNSIDGSFPGLNPLVRFPSFVTSQEALNNRQAVEAVNLKVQQWASGAALTDKQTAQVEKLTPDKNDTDKQVRTKLNGLTDLMLQQARAELAGQGVNASFPSTDFFGTKAPLDQDPLKVGTSPAANDPLSLNL